jgi:hypothetical protein
MQKAGQRQFQRLRGSPRFRLRFENLDLDSTFSKYDGGCETIGAGTDDASIPVHFVFPPLRFVCAPVTAVALTPRATR